MLPTKDDIEQAPGGIKDETEIGDGGGGCIEGWGGGRYVKP